MATKILQNDIELEVKGTPVILTYSTTIIVRYGPPEETPECWFLGIQNQDFLELKFNQVRNILYMPLDRCMLFVFSEVAAIRRKLLLSFLSCTLESAYFD